MRGLADLNVNIIATVGPNGDAAKIDVDPSRIRIVRFVPLDSLLTGVSVVVAHGGAGTVLASLSRGLPLVLLPQGADQFIHARQVASARAGIVLRPNEATPAAIRSALQQVLTNASIRGAAQDLAEEIAAMDSPDYVIEKLDRKLACLPEVDDDRFGGNRQSLPSICRNSWRARFDQRRSV